MAGGITMSLGNRKLVVLGIPWDVDTEGLRSYMAKFGDLDDVIVMKDRSTGRSRGFGYVTFSSPDDAERALVGQHSLNGRVLEVKVATPKEEMLKTPSKRITRVFVARIPPSVNDDQFRSYFESYGRITDAYMPKDQGSKSHRGIGFVTYEDPESVEKLMSETHELAGSTIAVDRATPKLNVQEETVKFWGKTYPSVYGPYGIYTNAAARFGAFGASAFGAYDYAQEMGYGGGLWSSSAHHHHHHHHQAAHQLSQHSGGGSKAIGNKIFVGRLPPDANAEDLRRYFGNFGRLLDVYVPKDAKKLSHRGFGFVTFADDSVAERVAHRPHEILGVQIAVDRATPQDDSSPGPGGGGGYAPGGAGGPMRGTSSSSTATNNAAAAAAAAAAYGLASGYDYAGGGGGGGAAGWLYGGDGAGVHRSSRLETTRYRPY